MSEPGGWEPEEFTSATCRPVTLDSGETVPVLGDRPLSPEGIAALKELIEAARARLAAENPPGTGAQSLWARVDARAYLLRVSVRDAAKQAGVAPSALSRLAQGRMPGPSDLARIETWLGTQEPAPH